MMTFEVNLLCDGERHRGACVTGEPVDRIEKAIESVEDEARANHWSFLDGKWYCPDCLKEYCERIQSESDRS